MVVPRVPTFSQTTVHNHQTSLMLIYSLISSILWFYIFLLFASYIHNYIVIHNYVNTADHNHSNYLPSAYFLLLMGLCFWDRGGISFCLSQNVSLEIVKTGVNTENYKEKKENNKEFCIKGCNNYISVISNQHSICRKISPTILRFIAEFLIGFSYDTM